MMLHSRDFLYPFYSIFTFIIIRAMDFSGFYYLPFIEAMQINFNIIAQADIGLVMEIFLFKGIRGLLIEKPLNLLQSIIMH